MSVVLLSGKVQFLTAYLRPACTLKVTSLQNVRLKSTSFLLLQLVMANTLFIYFSLFFIHLYIHRPQNYMYFIRLVGNVSHEQQKLNMHPSEVSFDKLTPISMGYGTTPFSIKGGFF